MVKICNKDYKFFKYNTEGIFATGRIKRMRAKDVYPFVDLTKRTRKKYSDAFPRCFATITRWNRH